MQSWRKGFCFWAIGLLFTFLLTNPDSILAVTLEVTNSGSSIVLAWFTNVPNYQLQSRLDISDATSWQNLAFPTNISEGKYRIVIEPAAAASYYRLVKGTNAFTNSIGMAMIPIPSGTFTMGYWQTDPLPPDIIYVFPWVYNSGDFDERGTSHQVTISHGFWMGAYEVSNKEYEQFDPGHAVLRGKLGFSTDDNEAAVFVSWNDAQAFCAWLSARDGEHYRLPTEAEWEYACRAGTTTHFSTGDTLPSIYQKDPGNIWYPISGESVPIFRGQTPPNPWGLYDMHGNVEEWCSDWYGPYSTLPQTDPVGQIDGIAKVCRGGSHSTLAFYLRSENRSGSIPEDRSWYTGFRVVLGNYPSTAPLPMPPPALFQSNVSQTIPSGLTSGPNPNVPFFKGPLRYVNCPTVSYGPIYSDHNHDTGGIVECPNGDLFTVWYTCVTEYGREMALAASRLRYGATNWDDASSIFEIPDRADTAPCLAFDGDKTLTLIWGVAAAGTWGPLALVKSSSTNNGADWTHPQIIAPDHVAGHQPIGSSLLQLANGTLLLGCDADPNTNGGTFVWTSRDNGNTWYNPADNSPMPTFAQGNTGAWIAGIHAAITQLSDGRLLALGREDNINNRMPMSVSLDDGTNWSYSASPFPPIRSAQRATILRLHEGALMFASFSTNITITNAVGGTRTAAGLFVATSLDNGTSWPFWRLVSDDGPGRTVETLDGVPFTLSYANAEPYGYLSSTQGKNGVIHLISSREHYQFNLKWLMTRPAF